MTHRERVMAALAHQEPDRVPMDLGGSLASGIVGEAYPGLRKFLGLPEFYGQEARRYTSLAQIDEDVHQILDVDMVHGPHAFGGGHTIKVLSSDTFIDEWGVRWRKPEHGHYYVERASFELEATAQAVEKHAWRKANEMVCLDGFILAAVHNIQPEVPPANIVELFRAGKDK